MIFKKNIEKLLKDIQLPIANFSFKQAIKNKTINIKETDNEIIILLSYVLPEKLIATLKKEISKKLETKNIMVQYQIHTRKTQPNLQPLNCRQRWCWQINYFSQFSCRFI